MSFSDSANTKSFLTESVYLSTTSSIAVNGTEKLSVFDDYQNKCRLCFELFGNNSMKIIINGVQRNFFYKFTGIPLDLEYSKYVCTKCSTDLNDCQEFINRVTELQKQFYEFVTVTQPPIKNELYCNNGEEDFQDVPFVTSFLKSTNDEIFGCTKNCSVKLERVDLANYDVSSEHFEHTYGDNSSNHDVDDFKMNFLDHNKNDSESDSSNSFASISPNCLISQTKKPRIIPRPFNLPTTRRMLYCDHCDYSTLLRKNLTHHLFKHHAKEKANKLCSSCGKTFASSKALSVHIRKVHSSTSKRSSIQCWVCNLEFQYNHILVNHIRWYHPNEDKKFHCEKCPEQFYTETSLRRHDEITHNATIKCKDENCTRLFYEKKTMDRHYSLVHKRERGVSFNT